MTELKQEIDAQINKWRFRLFKILSLLGIFAGGITLGISMIAVIENQLKGLYIIDPLIYGLWIVNSLVAYARLQVRFLVFLILLYVLGVSLLFLVGPYAGGLNWLFVFSVLAIVFFNARAMYFTLAINAFTLLLLYGLFYFPEIIPAPFQEYGRVGFMAVASNFLVINVGVCVPVGFMINRLRSTLYNEVKINENLNEERRNLEEAKKRAEESDKLKTRLLQNISHEIRTPLNAITRFADLLTPDMERKKQNEFIDIIHRNTNQLLMLIDNIVELSQLQASSKPLELQPLHVDEFLSNSYHNWKNKIPEEVSISMNCDTNKPDTCVMGNAYGLKRVLTNLLDNSAKFTHKGRIEVGCRSTPKHGLLFYVKDTGQGIAPEEQKRVFERFYKTNSPHKHFYAGTGLGLSLAKILIEKMHGSIWLHSRAGKGTTFFFTLPECHTSEYPYKT